MFMYVYARETVTYLYTYLHITLPHITHLTAKPSRMIGVQVGVWCLCARAQTPVTLCREQSIRGYVSKCAREH